MYSACQYGVSITRATHELVNSWLGFDMVNTIQDTCTSILYPRQSRRGWTLGARMVHEGRCLSLLSIQAAELCLTNSFNLHTRVHSAPPSPASPPHTTVMVQVCRSARIRGAGSLGWSLCTPNMSTGIRRERHGAGDAAASGLSPPARTLFTPPVRNWKKNFDFAILNLFEPSAP